MSHEVQHIELPTASLFVQGRAAAITRRESYDGPKAVMAKQQLTGKVAPWGTNNDFPHRVMKDVRRTSILAGVIERKVDLLISGGLAYGFEEVDPRTGFRRLIPQQIDAVDGFLEDINLPAFLAEAAKDWYTFYNVFPEFRMGRGYDRVVGMGIQDAVDVRLEAMDKNGNINGAFLADWENGATDSDAFRVPVLENYGNPGKQLLERRLAHAILPIRYLNGGQRYYGLAPWNSLRANGTIDIANRIMELKKLLMDRFSHIRYWFEIDERYWEKVVPDWAKLDQNAKLSAMKRHVSGMEEWMTSDGQGGSYMSTMLPHNGAKDQTSLVKMHEMKFTIPDGAYIEDTQETHFIICRDSGLKPSLHGISPSKSGSSPGSGSEDRVARTNHVLDCWKDQQAILRPFHVVKTVNGWDRRLKFWFHNYYAATLDRTNQVDSQPNAGPER